MKHTFGNRIWAMVLAICLIFGMIPAGFAVEAQAVSGISSLTCASFISNTTRQNYIDTMMQYYINNNSKLQTALDSGLSVVFMFEGGSDNYTTSQYDDVTYDVRNQAVVIVVQKNSSGNAEIVYYCEDCSSIPDDANWCTGAAYTGSTTVLDGIYSISTVNHNGSYAALTTDASVGWYCPTAGSTGYSNGANGINIHTRKDYYAGGEAAGYAQSEGCQVIGYGADSSNAFNGFMKAVAGITWDSYSTTRNTFASTGANMGYYVVDRQLGLLSPDGTEYGAGSLMELYTEGDLAGITAFSTAARANAGLGNTTLSAPVISGCSVPSTMNIGDVFTVTGTISSPGTITKVEVGCYDASGNAKTSATATPYTTTYNIYNLDNYIEFNTLAAGTYYYKVMVTTASGTTTLVNSKFTVLDNTAITISGNTTPTVMTTGSCFTVAGTVSSGVKITNVTVGCYNVSGTALTSASATPNATSYNIGNLDYYIAFDQLTPGIYYYKITATNSAGTTTLVKKVFTVLATGRTVADGSYALVPTASTSYAVHVAGDSNTSGANVELYTKATSGYQAMKVTHVGSGYYTLQFVSSGMLLTASGTASGSKVNQSTANGSDSQKWQILPVGSGYCLVPKSATGTCLHIQSGTYANGTNILVCTRSLGNAQRFKLETMTIATTTTTTPTYSISGHSVPTTMTTGGVFSVTGTVTSSEKLTKVTVGCYDVNGTMLTGASATPNATTYNVANLDYYVAFNELDPGVYYYRITATSASGSKRLVNAVFTVLATGRTVSDGIYVLKAASSTGYALDIASSSSANGANVELSAVDGTTYQAIRVKHVGSGYYTLQFVATGMMLTVKNSGTTSGTNVQQNVPTGANSQKWQILPVGTGYCLVPKNATGMCLDITGGTYANGTNIEIYKRNLGGAQRFKLVSSSAAKASVSGCSVPTTLSVGGVFSVTGTVSATQNITKVTVACVNASGTVYTSASATPNAKSYNLAYLDYYVEFNILPAGTYYYKVTITTASGTEVLVNSRFTVS